MNRPTDPVDAAQLVLTDLEPAGLSLSPRQAMYILGICAAIAAALLAVVAADPAWRVVGLPVTMLTATFAVFVFALALRDGSLPVDDIGLWTAMAIWLYGALPPLVYLVFGYVFTGLADSRLLVIQPTPIDVARACWYFVLYIIGFVTACLAMRGRPVSPRALDPLPRSHVAALAITLVTVIASRAGIAIAFSLDAETYIDSYLLVQQLPLAVRQVYGIAGAMESFLLIAAFVYLFSTRRWAWLAAYGLFILTSTVLALGSRTDLMIALVCYLLLYHRFVAPIGLARITIVGTVALIAFMALGVMRAGGEALGDFTPGEFLVVFTNVLDLQSRNINSVPAGVYLFEFFGFIPAHLWPIEKVSASAWYVGRFYPEVAERGGGLAFGVIAQSLIGFGVPEIIMRGIATGVVSAAAMRFYRARAAGFWTTCLYLWMLVMSYQTVRSSSFVWITPFTQRVLPAVACVIVVAWVLRGIGSSHTAIGRPSRRTA